MKDEIKQFLEENWEIAATIIGAGVLLIMSYLFGGCGSTWRISGNTVTVNEKCQNDSITHHNDTINDEIREVP